MARDPGEFFEVQGGSGGGPIGPKLKGTLFIPYAMGVAWQDASGNWWKQYLVDNGDGTVDIRLAQVTP